MILNLSDVLSEQHKAIHESVPIEMTCFKSEMGDYAITEKTPLELSVEYAGDRKLEVTGKAEITSVAPCDRCLEEVRTRIPFEFKRKLDMKLKRFFAAALAGTFLALSLTACGGTAAQEMQSIQVFAMDTVMDLTAYGENAAAALTDASREINRLERLLSRTIDTSEISQINAGGAVTVSEETASLLAQAQTYTAATDGAFDITIAPLVSLWGITTDSPYVPTQQEIDALLPLVGPEHLHLSGDTATLDDGCAIDLGGIAKGYASDRVAAIFARHGITSGTISLGGNVYVCGSKPNGQPWVVAIQDPRSNGYAVTVALTDSFAVTSGGYQRYYTAPDGTVYQHILDPKTGYPVESDLLSVSILCDNGTMADAYSTALYVMGSAGAQAFWRTCGGFEMILITTAGQVLYTPGLSEKITPTEGSGYEYVSIHP